MVPARPSLGELRALGIGLEGSPERGKFWISLIIGKGGNLVGKLGWLLSTSGGMVTHKIPLRLVAWEDGLFYGS